MAAHTSLLEILCHGSFVIMEKYGIIYAEFFIIPKRHKRFKAEVSIWCDLSGILEMIRCIAALGTWELLSGSHTCL